jgi:hypothetical protein
MLCLCCLTFYASRLLSIIFGCGPTARLTSFALFFLPFSAFFFIIGFSAWRPTASMAFLSHHFPGLARCVCCEGVLPQTRVLHTCASPDFSSSDGFGLTTFSGFFWSLSLRHSTSFFCVRPSLPALGRTLHAPMAALRNHSEGFGFDQDIRRWRSKYQ